MKLLGLNGFGFWYGRIDRYFRKSSGCFPYRWNWGYRHVQQVMDEYTEQFGNEQYIGIGFSDGATLLHEVAQLDRRCVGFVAHSGMWRLPRTAQFQRPVPCLLLRTNGDITPTYRATEEAYEFYEACNVRVTMANMKKTTWHGHEFVNGISMADLWCRTEFGYRLELIP